MSTAVIDKKLFHDVRHDNLLKTTLNQLIKAFGRMGIDVKVEKSVNTDYYLDEDFYSSICNLDSDDNDLDNYLLYLLYTKEVHYLITDDEGIHLKAESLGIEDKVIYLKLAYDMFAINNTVGRKFPKHYW